MDGTEVFRRLSPNKIVVHDRLGLKSKMFNKYEIWGIGDFADRLYGSSGSVQFLVKKSEIS